MFHGTGPQTNIVWPIARRVFEINVTNRCNLRCPHCQACVDSAPDDSCIELAHVRRFVKTSIDKGVVWQKLKLTGGEAALHPKIQHVVHMLGHYRLFLQEAVHLSGLDIEPCAFRILTNGSPESRRTLKKLPAWLHRQDQDTLNSKAWQRFESFLAAPVDHPAYRHLPDEVYRQGCLRLSKCGGGALGTDGKYYPCAVAYQIARVHRLDVGLPDLQSFLAAPEEQLRDILQKTCKLCGYFVYPRQDAKPDTPPSHAWRHAIKEYKACTTK